MKTKGYVSVYTLIVFMLLVGIITVLILGLRFESKKAINKESYYQNVLIARSVYYRIKNDDRFIEVMKNPTKNLKKSITIEDLGLDCYDKKVSVKLDKGTRGFYLYYRTDYRGTVTSSTVNFKENSSTLFNENSKVSAEDKDMEALNNNTLDKIEGNLVFYQKGDNLFYLQEDRYDILIEEYNRAMEEPDKVEEPSDEPSNEKPDEQLEKPVEEFDIGDHLEAFNKVDGDCFYSLDNFTVLSSETPKLKGICLMKEEGEKKGPLYIDGVLINHSNFKDVKVNGKVVEVSKFQGDCKLNLESVKRLKDYTGLDDSPKILGFFIK
ncbi:hypothetical protein [Lagierella sp.]|uniref:hypothetical protein n=1 Tax=Lagierella sp. TaxID=2849657 RepID=UPI00262B5898|nr:hypothetical protein [Lagierella sp.]